MHLDAYHILQIVFELVNFYLDFFLELFFFHGELWFFRFFGHFVAFSSSLRYKFTFFTTHCILFILVTATYVQNLCLYDYTQKTHNMSTFIAQCTLHILNAGDIRRGLAKMVGVRSSNYKCLAQRRMHRKVIGV